MRAWVSAWTPGGCCNRRPYTRTRCRPPLPPKQRLRPPLLVLVSQTPRLEVLPPRARGSPPWTPASPPGSAGTPAPPATRRRLIPVPRAPPQAPAQPAAPARAWRSGLCVTQSPARGGPSPCPGRSPARRPREASHPPPRRKQRVAKRPSSSCICRARGLHPRPPWLAVRRRARAAQPNARRGHCAWRRGPGRSARAGRADARSPRGASGRLRRAPRARRPGKAPRGRRTARCDPSGVSTARQAAALPPTAERWRRLC
mmetsp:Transcript_41494/g.129296  ORF Transcript_41494/g.129296 Transcript_41494/m.129296 type:complete len:258 (-) Transcript_41494:686-1459(-)